MAIVERIKSIILKPKEEWEVIAGETSSTADLLKNYALPLAAIGAIATFIGNSLIGRTYLVATVRIPVANGLVQSVLGLVVWLVAVYVAALIIDGLAPKFGGEKNSAQALKVAIYSATPGWVGGVLAIVPSLAVLGLLAHLYGVYLLYLGLQRLMKSPPEKASSYTAAVAGCWIGVMFVASLVIGAIAGAGMVASGALSVR